MSKNVKTRKSSLRIAIIGNPNSGKSTIFNKLTGTNQFTGNWSGSTVEKSTGIFIHNATQVEVIDLPGLYSLAAAKNKSTDQNIALQFLLQEPYDFIINVVDATNLDRHLYLSQQLKEAGVPVLLVVNMLDKLNKHASTIDTVELSHLLAMPAMAICAKNAQHINELKAKIVKYNGYKANPLLSFNAFIQAKINKIIKVVGRNCRYPNLQAIQSLEEDAEYLIMNAKQKRQVEKIKAEFREEYDDKPELILASFRYEFIKQITDKVIVNKSRIGANITDKLDAVLLNKYGGMFFLGLFLYLMFTLSIALGGIFQQSFELISAALFKDGVAQILTLCAAPIWLIDVLAYGVGGGVATVAMFIPVIGSLYLFQAVLEDSGYMARASILLDRFFKLIGLQGKAFVPLIIGFGCNVPAILAARTLNNPKEKIITIVMSPFMSCSGRLSVYALFCSAFFKDNSHNIVFILYLIGIVVAIITAKVLSYALDNEASQPLIMELPNYHMPSLRNILTIAYHRLKGFVVNAGKLIVIVYVALHLIGSVGADGSFGNNNNENSLLSVVSKKLTFIFHPIGITENNWPATVGIFTGIFAKEVVVGTLNALYDAEAPAANKEFNFRMSLQKGVASIGNNIALLFNSQKTSLNEIEEDKSHILSTKFLGALGAFTYLLFILLYFPCISVFAVIAQELNLKWAFFSVIFSTLLAYFVAMLFFQGANLYIGSHYSYSLLIVSIIGVLGVFIALSIFARKIDASS